MNNDAHLNLNILGVPQYLEWVDYQIITNCAADFRTNRSDASIYTFRASAYVDRQNYSGALKDYERSINLNPTNAIVLNSCAWLLAVCPEDSIRDGKQAVKFATQACQLTQWKQWNFVGTLAAAYAEAGDFDKAIKYERQAMGITGIPSDEIEGENRRLKLFEQQMPDHETPGNPMDLL